MTLEAVASATQHLFDSTEFGERPGWATVLLCFCVYPVESLEKHSLSQACTNSSDYRPRIGIRVDRAGLGLDNLRLWVSLRAVAR